MLSILIHAGLFLLAGMLVVFTVVRKEDKKFEPPTSIERPKMQLKKLKPKVRKSSKPKSASPIMTKVKPAKMPTIQLPEMSGLGSAMGSGTGGDPGGFEGMLDIGEITLIGSGKTIGNDFEGTFYDLKRDRSGRTIPMSPDATHEVFKKFLTKGWSKRVLADYYQSPKKIFATTFMVPPVRANLAPEIFGEKTEGWGWGIHFTGELVYPEDIKFRFWGNGLHVMAVRVDGQIVLLSYWEKDDRPGFGPVYEWLWKSDSADNRKYPLGLFKSHVGDWIELKANEPLKMEVLYGISGGGIFNAMLCVEVEGEEYPRSPYMGGPILPIFKTEPLSIDLREVIEASLYPGFGSLTNGPVFRDYAPSIAKATREDASGEVADTDEATPAPIEEKMRMWTTGDGKSFEAEFVMDIGDQVWMKNRNGQQEKIPKVNLSAEDLIYIELINPPEFSIELSKKSWQVPEMPNITEVDKSRPIKRLNYVFGARVKQKGLRPYTHPLIIEYFAFGEEVDGDNYVLFDRGKDTFTPSKENNLGHEFQGEAAELLVWAMDATKPLHGTKYGGFLITITDERGIIIHHKVTHNFLLENLENLKNVPRGKHFNKACNRVGPPRPGLDDISVNSY